MQQVNNDHDACLVCSCKKISDAHLEFYDIFRTVIRAKYLSEYMDELFDIQVYPEDYVGSKIICELCVDSIDGFIELKKIAYSSNIFFEKNASSFNQSTTDLELDQRLIPSTSSGNGANAPTNDVIDLCDSSNDSIE